MHILFHKFPAKFRKKNICSEPVSIYLLVILSFLHFETRKFTFVTVCREGFLSKKLFVICGNHQAEKCDL